MVEGIDVNPWLVIFGLCAFAAFGHLVLMQVEPVNGCDAAVRRISMFALGCAQVGALIGVATA